jgi:hypothetical protein
MAHSGYPEGKILFSIYLLWSWSLNLSLMICLACIYTHLPYKDMDGEMDLQEQ